jgi:hypothetical protein
MRRLLAIVETVAADLLLTIAMLTSANIARRDVLSVHNPDCIDGSKNLIGIA